MKAYIFDVDDTLERCGGSVRIETIRYLARDNIVGLCGNWARAFVTYPDDIRMWTFIGPMEMTKATFLKQIKTYTDFDKYILVDDLETYRHSAETAGFIFVTSMKFYTYLAEGGS